MLLAVHRLSRKLQLAEPQTAAIKDGKREVLDEVVMEHIK